MTDFSVFWNCLMTLVTPDTHDTHVPQKHGDYGFMARKLRLGLAEITASLTEGFWSQQMPQIAQIFKTRRKRKKPQKKNHEKHRKELTNCLVV